MVARWAATISNGFALHYHSVVQHCLLADESIRHKYTYLTVLIKLIHLDFLFGCLFNECPACYGVLTPHTPHMLVIFLFDLQAILPNLTGYSFHCDCSVVAELHCTPTCSPRLCTCTFNKSDTLFLHIRAMLIISLPHTYPF